MAQDDYEYYNPDEVPPLPQDDGGNQLAAYGDYATAQSAPDTSGKPGGPEGTGNTIGSGNGPAPGPVSTPGYDGYGLHDVGKGGDADTWINEGDVLGQLKASAKANGVSFDDSDYQGILRNISYDKGGSTLQQAIDNQKNIYAQRGAPTASAGGSGGDAGVGGQPGVIKPGWVKGPGGQYTFQGPATAGTTTTTGPGLQNGSSGLTGGRQSSDQLLQQLKALGIDVAGPASSGVFPSDNLQQVGQDPFSQMISGGYADLLNNGGQSNLGKDTEETLRGLISRGGQVTEDPSVKAQRFEAARQPIESMRKAQTAQLRGSLANRNLLSEPGQPQGSEIGAMGRMEESLAPYYATAGQNLAGDQANADNARLSQSLQLATGLSQAQTATMLQTLGDATQRQEVLSNIALSTLDRNIVWNKFLAEFGLEREKVLLAAQQGGMEAILPLLQMFGQFINSSNGGYI